MKKTLLAVLLVLILCMATACGGGSIDGYYKMTGGVFEKRQASYFEEEGGFYLIVNKDKTFKACIGGSIWEGSGFTWDEQNFFWSDDDGMKYEFKDNVLSMSLTKNPSAVSPIFTKVTNSDEISKIDEAFKNAK